MKKLVGKSVSGDMVNKKIKVDSLSVKLFGAEDLKQGSYSDGSFFFISVIAILVLTNLIFYKQPAYKQLNYPS